ncbi:MAG: L-histidine N(alpha)-methyltransferase [bacterium]|nr:L-histidine N(alpha)-methyltransferase [bacterium]
MATDATQRLTIHRVEAPERRADFAEDTREGLSGKPKSLSPKYLYDDLGSALFETITLLPEYYQTRAESEILEDQHEAILDSIPGTLRLVELGSGSANKTRVLIDTILKRQNTLEYIPIEISETTLENSSKDLLRWFPGLRITGFASDYENALGALARDYAAAKKIRTVALFLGSTIGNLEPEDRYGLLSRIRTMLEAQDALVLGTDLKKSLDVLIPAYDDALGVTAAFNLNLLRRINEELGGEFDLSQFEHEARYDEDHGRIEMHLVSKARQSVKISKLTMTVRFEKGETIHTENSYKFDPEQLSSMAQKAGFHLDRTWLDSKNQFGLSLFTAQ